MDGNERIHVGGRLDWRDYPPVPGIQVRVRDCAEVDGFEVTARLVYYGMTIVTGVDLEFAGNDSTKAIAGGADRAVKVLLDGLHETYPHDGGKAESLKQALCAVIDAWKRDYRCCGIGRYSAGHEPGCSVAHAMSLLGPST